MERENKTSVESDADSGDDDDQVEAWPERSLLGQEVLDMPEGDPAAGYLDPVGHGLALLVREGVHRHRHLSGSSGLQEGSQY